MGFNKRKMEDRRRNAAEKEAAARRALGPQIIEDSVKLIEFVERAPGRAHAYAVLANDRGGQYGGLLVPAGALPGLPHRWRCRPAEARLAPRCGRDGAYPGTVVPLLRPNAPFAELVCLSKSNVAEEYYAERSGNGFGCRMTCHVAGVRSCRSSRLCRGDAGRIAKFASLSHSSAIRSQNA